jgi:RNA ligase (TIGR02306 family)
MSTHSVNVIEIERVLPHTNAERLEIVPVGGWQAVVKKGQFLPGDRAVYIEPDYTVPTRRQEFSFLAKDGRERHRLKAVRLRGVLSFGLLIPLPDELKDRAPGDNVMNDLGIERYEPPVKLAHSDELPIDECPQVYASKFDVESLQKFSDILVTGESVIVTEKIHGANARYLFLNGVFYMGSRTRWLKPNISHEWRRASDSEPRIKAWCVANPGIVLYGEIYGSVQSLKYGAKPGEIKFAAFAASSNGDWIDTARLLDDDALPTVPVLYRGPYVPEIVLPLAEADSTVISAEIGHMREGIVIVPERERRDDEIGRVALKHISNRYWESAA